MRRSLFTPNPPSSHMTLETGITTTVKDAFGTQKPQDSPLRSLSRVSIPTMGTFPWLSPLHNDRKLKSELRNYCPSLPLSSHPVTVRVREERAAEQICGSHPSVHGLSSCYLTPLYNRSRERLGGFFHIGLM